MLHSVHLCYLSFLMAQQLRYACQFRRLGFNPWVRKIPWRRKWQWTPVFLPGESHGQRSLVGYSPWGHKRVRHDLTSKQQSISPMNVQKPMIVRLPLHILSQKVTFIFDHAQFLIISQFIGWAIWNCLFSKWNNDICSFKQFNLIFWIIWGKCLCYTSLLDPFKKFLFFSCMTQK